MGRIRTEGRARRKVSPERCKVTLTFKAVESNVSNATHKIKNQCEQFLQELRKKKIIEPSEVKLKNDESSYVERNGKYVAIAERKLVFDIIAKASVMNKLLSVVSGGSWNVEIRTEYYITYESELRKELMKEATSNSKELATIIAASQGEELVGIDRVNIRDHEITDEDEWRDLIYGSGGLAGCADILLSDEMKMNELEFNEYINVEWLSEKH